MSDENVPPSLTNRHQGVFNEHVVYGRRYQRGSGQTAWHITAWPKTNVIHDYWVEAGVFTQMNEHTVVVGTSSEIAEAEKRAILTAIEQWEHRISSRAA